MTTNNADGLENEAKLYSLFVYTSDDKPIYVNGETVTLEGNENYTLAILNHHRRVTTVITINDGRNAIDNTIPPSTIKILGPIADNSTTIKITGGYMARARTPPTPPWRFRRNAYSERDVLDPPHEVEAPPDIVTHLNIIWK